MTEQQPLSDTPGDFERKMLRLFGVLDEAPCDICEKVRPIAKLNVFQMEKDPEELPPDRLLLCDDCLKEELLAPVANRALGELRESPELSESLESSLARAAMSENVSEEERQQAVEALKGLIHNRQQRRKADEGEQEG